MGSRQYGRKTLAAILRSRLPTPYARLRVTMSRTSGDSAGRAAIRFSIASACRRRVSSSERQERIAVRSRAAICGLRRVERDDHLLEKRETRAVGAVELRVVGGESADQRPHAIRVGHRESAMAHQRPHAVERLALGDLRLQREPLVEDQRLHRVAAAERVEACSRVELGLRTIWVRAPKRSVMLSASRS